MRIQTLVTTMNQNDYGLLEKMNIQSDAIIGNQCDFNRIDKFEYKGYKITYLNFAERGVGLNRNNSLMRATGDICLFADDDMRFFDGYKETVKNVFSRLPEADVVVFNIKQDGEQRAINQSTHRVHFYNFLRYGTARIAVKLSSIHENGIHFNLCYGGGTPHSHGEDNIFLSDCLRKGLKIFAVPEYIAELTNERESTWKRGYTNKYVSDQGLLYRQVSRLFYKPLCLQDAIRKHKQYGMSVVEAYKTMSKE